MAFEQNLLVWQVIDLTQPSNGQGASPTKSSLDPSIHYENNLSLSPSQVVPSVIQSDSLESMVSLMKNLFSQGLYKSLDESKHWWLYVHPSVCLSCCTFQTEHKFSLSKPYWELFIYSFTFSNCLCEMNGPQRTSCLAKGCTDKHC